MKFTNSKKLLFFWIFFFFLNLLFVPLLSVYGLKACPVLSIPGFGFGCYYTGLYITLVFSLSFISSLLTRAQWINRHKIFGFIFRFRSLNIFLTYLMSTFVSLAFLSKLLSIQHLSTQSRAPIILMLASLLLAVIQIYGLSWAESGSNPNDDKYSISDSWIYKSFEHFGKITLPLIIFSAVLLHFLFSQSNSFTHGRVAKVFTGDEIIEQTGYLIAGLLVWMIVTYIFHFLNEKNQLVIVDNHLRSIEKLDFDYRSNSRHSFGLWSLILNNLNQFSSSLKDKNRLVTTFSKFVTLKVAEAALKKDLTPSNGETRILTVIMIDIRNFTQISEQYSAEVIVKWLNEYFSFVIDIFNKKNIIVDKFIGDGILAYVEPNITEVNNNQTTAIKAALEILERLNDLNHRLTLKGLPQIQVGIGIDKGPVVVGFLGSEDKLQYTIIGETVNRTARLEGLAKTFNSPLIISDSVWECLTPQIQSSFKIHSNVVVPGIRNKLVVYSLMR